MAKSPLERQIESQMKQAKQLADKKRREDEKRAREQKRMEQKAIVCDSRRDSHVNFSDDIFPSYVQMSVGVELEKLIQYGMIGGLLSFDNGGMLDLLPPAFSYFEDKQAALDRQDKREKERQQSIINYGNLVFGNVSGSTLTVDNSIHQIEQAIDEKGGEDKEELHELLDEVKELIENIQSSRAIPKQKKLFEKISNHMEKHGWFYGAVVQLLGTAALGLLGT